MRRIGLLVIAVTFAACGASLTLASDVRAQGACGGASVAGKSGGTSREDQAKSHFDAARKHYANGRYREAIAELKAARACDPSGADLLYNLGVILEKLQQFDEAIVHYRQYIEMIEDEKEKERVRGIVVRLERAREQLAAQSEAEAAVPVEQGGAAQGPVRQDPVAERPVAVGPARDKGPAEEPGVNGWVIGTGVLAGLGLVGGTYFGLQAMKNKNDDQPTTGGGTTYADLEENADKARQQALYADIGFGVALAAGTTAMILLFSGDAKDADSAERRALEAGVAALPGRAGASLRIGF